MQSSNKMTSDNEIDLVEVFISLYKRKKLIITTALLVTILAIIYVFVATPWYKAKATIEIGSYRNTNKLAYLERGKSIEKLLKVKYIDIFKETLDRDVEISSIISNKGVEQFITIVSMGKSNELAIKEIKDIVNTLKEKHKKIIDEIILSRQLTLDKLDRQIYQLKNNGLTIIKEKISYIKKTTLVALENKIITLQKELDEANNQLKTATDNLTSIRNNNPSLAALRIAQIQALESKIAGNKIRLIDFDTQKKNTLLVLLPELERRIDRIDRIDIPELESKRKQVFFSMQPYNYKNTEVVGEIVTKKSPEKPKKIIIILASIILGIILGIILALFTDFIRTARQHRNMPNK